MGVLLRTNILQLTHRHDVLNKASDTARSRVKLALRGLPFVGRRQSASTDLLRPQVTVSARRIPVVLLEPSKAVLFSSESSKPTANWFTCKTKVSKSNANVDEA